MFKKTIFVVTVPSHLEDGARAVLQKQVTDDIAANKPVVLQAGMKLEVLKY